MNPADYAKAFTEFWTAQSQSMGQAMGEAVLKAQEQTGRVFAEGVQAMASGTVPGLPSGPSAEAAAGAAGLGQASQAMLDLWSAATAMSGAIAARLPASDGDSTVESAMARIVDPRQWLSGTGEMDQVVGRLAEGPRFADLWEVERRYATVMQAWMGVRRRSLEHNAVMLEAWMQAGRRFTEALGGQVGAEAQAPDPKAVLALWTETANRQLLETQRSDAFLASQRETIRASTALRVAQTELVEHFGKQYGFPTRGELDDVHRTVTELRREVRRLKQEQRRAAEAAPAPASPASAPAPQPASQQTRRQARRGGSR